MKGFSVNYEFTRKLIEVFNKGYEKIYSCENTKGNDVESALYKKRINYKVRTFFYNFFPLDDSQKREFSFS